MGVFVTSNIADHVISFIFLGGEEETYAVHFTCEQGPFSNGHGGQYEELGEAFCVSFKAAYLQSERKIPILMRGELATYG